MRKYVFGLILLVTAITGCQPAIIASAIRESDRENASMETRCESLDMRDSSDLKQVLSKYDGWRMIYVSEYTTANKFGTAGLICFERKK